MAPAADPPAVALRLREAAASGGRVEVILALRGRVASRGDGRWRVRAPGGAVMTFPAGAVVAVTPLAPTQAAVEKA